MTGDLWLSLVIAAFADYRISRMLAVETGPWKAFFWMRGWIVEHYPGKDKGWVVEGVTCPLCWSFWISPLFAILLFFQLHLDWPAIFWLWFALSGAVVFLVQQER